MNRFAWGHTSRNSPQVKRKTWIHPHHSPCICCAINCTVSRRIYKCLDPSNSDLLFLKVDFKKKAKKLNSVFQILRSEITVWDTHNDSQMHQIEPSKVSVLRKLPLCPSRWNELRTGRLSLPKEIGHCLSQGWWLKTKPWLLAFEWLYSCQEVTLFLRIQRTKEGVLEATAVEQTDISLSLTQPGQVRNPSTPTSRRMKRRHLICLCSNFNKIKTLKTIGEA